MGKGSGEGWGGRDRRGEEGGKERKGREGKGGRGQRKWKGRERTWDGTERERKGKGGRGDKERDYTAPKFQFLAPPLSTGRGFESRQPCSRVQPWASCLHNTPASVAKQYNLVPANGQRRFAAGKVTAGLAESNGSLVPVYDFHHLRADCR